MEENTDELIVNKDKILLADQLIAARESQRRLLEVKGKEDLFIFNKYVLGMEKGKTSVPLMPFHKKLCHFVTDNKNRKKLILMPRGHLKSTMITVGYSVQSIVNNPNIRILLQSATWEMAVDFLTEIKRHLRENEDLIKLYGDLTIGATEWSSDRIAITRTDQNIKGPTVKAAGIETNLVGSHPDLIIIDDPHNRDNSQTAEQIESVINRFRDCIDLLEPGGQLIVIGTRWNVVDLYGWIQDKDNHVYQDFDVMVEKSFEGDIETGEGFVSLWPDKFPLKELQSRLRADGWYQFSSQYQNNPIPEQDATFKRETFQTYDPLDIRGKEMIRIMTIDPAISLDKAADYTGIVTCGIDTFGNIFILDIWRGRVLPAELINKVFEIYENFKPNHVGIETVAYQKALAYSIREQMNQRRRYLPIEEIQPHERSKDQRIKGLQPLYENRKVFHPKDHRMKFYFEQELVEFPRGGHDDMIDAFSYALDFLHPPVKHKERYKGRQYLY
jgi:predicted phage terminase large subunit-like protein